MGGDTKKPPIPPELAGELWRAMQEPSIAKLAAALEDRGTPVTTEMLQRWRKAGWKTKVRREHVKPEQVEEELQGRGVSLAVINEKRKKYEALAYAAMVERTGRNALVTANVGMELIQEFFIEWASDDSRGLGALCLSMAAMIRDGQTECEKAEAMAAKVLGDDVVSGRPALPQRDDPLDSVMYEFGLKRLPAGNSGNAPQA